MALKGAGDPRWVVRERTDGRNVNGWHWEDKDVTKWAEQRLKQLISSEECRFNSPSPGVHVLSVDSVDGDATLYNRKGVLKVLYDLKISGKWSSLEQAELIKTDIDSRKKKDEESDKEKEKEEKEKEKEKKKKIDEENNKIPSGEFKIDLFDDDPEVTATTDNKCTADDASTFRSSFLSNVAPKIVEKCCIFIRELHEGADQFIDGLTLPKVKTGTQSLGQSVTKSRTEVSSSSKKTSSSTGKETTQITMVESFTCRKDDWILALTDEARLSAITRNKAKIDSKPGGKWEILNGAATGEIISITPGEALEMKWMLSSWGKKDDKIESGIVQASVEDKDGKTEATVHVKGIPKGKESETEGFWRIQILQAMRYVMGWGDASKFAGM